MSKNDNAGDRTSQPVYDVVVNHELQYSIWPTDRARPLGWSAAGFSGTQDACLDHIEQVWTDMRPLSARRAAAE